MSFDEGVLLERLAGQLRQQVAPSVADEYLRTQAYMASVILERLARQATLGEQHRAAEAGDLALLACEMDRIFPTGSTQASESVPEDVLDALAALRSGGTVMTLGPLVEALYGWGPERLEAAAALVAIRSVLRRDIDRRMDIAR